MTFPSQYIPATPIGKRITSPARSVVIAMFLTGLILLLARGKFSGVTTK